MKIRKYEVWIANLEPKFGTEAGKKRPVLIVQTDLLNKVHPSTIICPITTKVDPEGRILRVHIKKGIAEIREDCDIMIDQIRAIDNRRFIRKIGELPKDITEKVKESIRIILDLID